MAKELSFSVNAETKKAQQQFDQLRSSIKEAEREIDELTKSFGENSKQADESRKKLADLNNAYDTLSKSATDLGAKFEDIYGELQPLSSRLGEMEDRMYEMALAGDTSSEAFLNLQAETVKMRKTIIAVDQSVDDLAENRGLATFGSQIGAIGQSLLTMDFDRANKQAAGLANTAANIDFGTAIKSVKQLGSTFLNLGKALLANPIFLIAAIIIGIVMAIKELMDRVGLLKVIMEAVGKVFEWIGDVINDYIIQPLKDLFDWLGLTNNAAIDAAEKQSKAAKKKADAQEESSNRIIQGLDNEIRRIKATGDESDEAFEKILAAEREKRVQLALTAKARAEEAIAALKAAILKGDLDEEEIANLKAKAKEQVAAAKQAQEEIKLGDLEADKARKDRRDTQTKAEKDALDKRAEDYKKYLANRLAAERSIEDLTLQLMAEGTEKQLAEIDVRYRRMREDAMKNENLTQTEKKAIIDLYNQLELQDEKKIADEKLKIQQDADAKLAEQLAKNNQEYLASVEALQEEIYQAGLSKQEKEIIAIQDEYFNKIEMAKQYGLETEALENEQQMKLDEIDKRYAEERQKRIEDEKQKRIENFNAIANEGQNFFGAMQGLSNAVAEAQISAAEGNEKKQEEIRKKAFERNKKIQIAMATISTIQGVINALTAQSVIPEPFGTILKAVNAAVVLGTGIANIVKIKNQKYQGGGGTPSASTGGGGGSVPSAASLNAPSLLSTGGNPDEVVSASSSKAQKTPVIKAVVTESDITSTQNRVSSVKETATL